MKRSKTIKRRPEPYVTICDNWEYLTYMPESLEIVYVDVYRGTREYDVIMRMKYCGHLFVGETEGYIDRIALTPLGYKIKMDRADRGEDDGPPNETNIQMADQWESAYKMGKLPWQLGVKNPYE